MIFRLMIYGEKWDQGWKHHSLILNWISFHLEFPQIEQGIEIM